VTMSAEFSDGGGTCSSQPVTRQRVEALNGRIGATVLSDENTRNGKGRGC
jgi:hypothetical protein